MIHSPPAPGIPSVLRIERHYTEQILSGKLTPGTLLPNSRELARLWGTSATTVQSAMRGLAAAGLVGRSQRSGTVVLDRRERGVIGLIIGPSLSDETAHYQRALCTALESRFNRYGLSTRIYDGVHPYSVSAAQEYHPLETFKLDQRYYEFKGLILLAIGKEEPAEIAESPLPKVRVGNAFRSDIIYDIDTLVREVLQRVEQEGRRKLAAFWFPGDLRGLKKAIDKAVAAGVGQDLAIEYVDTPLQKRGMHIEKDAFEAMEALVATWKADPTRQPDALLIMDDIVARAVSMSLLKNQIAVPEQMMMIVRATTGIEHHYALPVIRYEFSSSDTAVHLEELLWKRIRGEEIPPLPVLQQGQLSA
ncbi:MAG TPA: GntR family transcriptional regulator [Chthoniobacteraceae bacterium]|nr:GntR family transcriptional regulator [Chthoniobacteraceae bacterium]